MTKFCTFWSRVPPSGPQHCRVTDILLNSILFSQTESDNTQSTPSKFDNIHQNNKKMCCELMTAVMISIIKLAEAIAECWTTLSGSWYSKRWSMIMISKAMSDVIGVCKGKRWWQIDCWLKDVPQTPLSQANNEPRYQDIKKTRLSKNECSTDDQTITLGLQIFLDHRSSRTIDQKILMTLHPPPFSILGVH